MRDAKKTFLGSPLPVVPATFDLLALSSFVQSKS